jgi:ribonuclease VapC
VGRRRIADVIAVDTSALVAIALGEPERAVFLDAILASGRALVSAVSAVEARMVLHARRGEAMVVLLNQLLELPPFEVVAPTAQDLAAAHVAFVLYGRGSGHPARLNFGDVFSYALAISRGVPLLYKGDDFKHTDVRSALTSQGVDDLQGWVHAPERR